MLARCPAVAAADPGGAPAAVDARARHAAADVTESARAHVTTHLAQVRKSVSPRLYHF